MFFYSQCLTNRTRKKVQTFSRCIETPTLVIKRERNPPHRVHDHPCDFLRAHIDKSSITVDEKKSNHRSVLGMMTLHLVDNTILESEEIRNGRSNERKFFKSVLRNINIERRGRKKLRPF